MIRPWPESDQSSLRGRAALGALGRRGIAKKLLVFLAAAAAAAASCASIPSLNEPPLYSSYATSRKDAAVEVFVDVFVLNRMRARASDDLYFFSVERRADTPGAASFALVLQYTGAIAESIYRLTLDVDGEEVELGEPSVLRGYSGRFVSERVAAPLSAETVALVAAGKKLAVQYYGDYPTWPIEIPPVGLEALKSFLGD